MPRLIKEFMTRNPITIADHQSLATAHRMMREHGVRHLPVLSAGKLVGVVSMRDLYFIETLPGVKTDEVLVSEAMSSEVYTVSPDTPLDEVVREMADNKYGSVIVVDSTRAVGVFTTVDALRALLPAKTSGVTAPR
jgi:acetoin utilization protein AcuB